MSCYDYSRMNARYACSPNSVSKSEGYSPEGSNTTGENRQVRPGRTEFWHDDNNNFLRRLLFILRRARQFLAAIT